MTHRALVLSFAFSAIFLSNRSEAQQPKGGNQNGSSPTAASGASLQGLSWANQTWDTDLTGLPTDLNKDVVACYTLIYGNSGSQPLLLQPATSDKERAPFEQLCQVDQAGALTETDPGIRARCIAAKKKQGSGTTSFAGVKWSPPCATLDSKHPPLMGQTLVVAINTKNVALDRVKILNLNVTYQSGNTINPTPVRPSFGPSATSSTSTLAGGPYFLIWPNQIPGDNIASVNVNAIYTPPIPGDKWLNGTFYPAGSIVTPQVANGHYYQATVGGVSAPTGNTAPSFSSSTPSLVMDGEITWMDSGTSMPGGQGQSTSSGPWLPTNTYNRGQSIFDPYNGHYYTAISVAGGHLCPPAGPTQVPCGASGVQIPDPFSLPTIADGTVIWADRGATSPAGVVSPRGTATAYAANAWVDGRNGHFYQAVQAGTTSNGTFSFYVNSIPSLIADGTVTWQDKGTTQIGGASFWKAFTKYNLNDAILATTGEYYIATSKVGYSGPPPSQPFFAITQSNTTTAETVSAGGTLNVVWEDIGTTAPAGVASGQPADQTVSFLNLQFPQSHTLSYYNLASGVVYSGVRSKSFGFTGCPPAGSACVPVQTGSSAVIDPVLLFTVYPKPFDAEAHCPNDVCLFHFKQNPPGISFGLSLASPSSSFYLGGSIEILRNFQLAAGYNWAKEATLPSSSTSQGSQQTNSGTPITIQRFSSAPFVGLTLNISGFIQSLFSGGGAGGSSKGSSSSPTTASSSQ